jgi:hypothetical protein
MRMKIHDCPGCSIGHRRRQVEFTVAANSAIAEAVNGQRSLQNLYGRRLAASVEVEQDIARALTRSTSEDDSHPAPIERFRLVSGVVATHQSFERGAVWDLFENREALTAEMTSLVAARLNVPAVA